MSGGWGKQDTAAFIRDTAAAVCLETLLLLRTAVGAGGGAVYILLL